jgi:hypothetical protein
VGQEAEINEEVSVEYQTEVTGDWTTHQHTTETNHPPAGGGEGGRLLVDSDLRNDATEERDMNSVNPPGAPPPPAAFLLLLKSSEENLQETAEVQSLPLPHQNVLTLSSCRLLTALPCLALALSSHAHDLQVFRFLCLS